MDEIVLGPIRISAVEVPDTSLVAASMTIGDQETETLLLPGEDWERAKRFAGVTGMHP